MTAGKQKTGIILNFIIIISTIVAVAAYLFGPPDILGSEGVQCLKYFTTDSNILVAVGAAIMLRWEIKGKPAPKWALLLKLAGTVAVTITMVTTAFFLVPMAAVYSGMRVVISFYKGNTFILHLTTPVLALIAFLRFEREGEITLRDCLWGVAPTFVYSIVYILMVVILGVWDDWYGFTFGGRNEIVPIVMVVMYGASFGISVLERTIRRRGHIAK